MRTHLAFLAGSIVGLLSKLLRRGTGITWGGEIALRIDPEFVSHCAPRLTHRILVAGTNGKSTTSAMIAHILEEVNYRVVHNSTGANLLNGIAGTLIFQKDKLNGTVIGVFEADEAAFEEIVSQLKPDTIVFLNLFRDQLDRYGEVDIVANRWKKVVSKFPDATTLIANADDPLIVSIATSAKGEVRYFGIDSDTVSHNKLGHATDSAYCTECGGKLSYRAVHFSHLGDWYCTSCGIKRPELSLSNIDSPLPGTYNMYNTLAAVATVNAYKIPQTRASKSLSTFKPVFGRQEKIEINGKNTELYLSKNPVGFNESLRTAKKKDDKGCYLLVLNDRIPDGTDVSWIWDVDFEELLPQNVPIVVSGDRTFDMGLRVKYQVSSIKSQEETKVIQQVNRLAIEPDLHEAIETAFKKTPKGKTLYIFPTYSAMLDVRKILTGKKI